MKEFHIYHAAAMFRYQDKNNFGWMEEMCSRPERQEVKRLFPHVQKYYDGCWTFCKVCKFLVFGDYLDLLLVPSECLPLDNKVLDCSKIVFPSRD